MAIKYDGKQLAVLVEQVGKFMEKLPAEDLASLFQTNMNKAYRAGKAQRGFHAIRQKTNEDYEAQFVFQGCSEQEAVAAVWLCNQCAVATPNPVSYYVNLAVVGLLKGWSVDEVRYRLYQTCMANPRDELKTDTPEEQFFK